MRKLETHDVFKMARIIKAADIKTKIEEIFASANNKSEQDTDSVQEKVGMKILFSVIEACSGEKLEEMLYDFVADIVEKDAESIRHMSIDGLFDIFKEIAKMNNLTTFFNTAGRLVQK